MRSATPKCSASGTIHVGCELPSLALPPISAATLRSYADASGDHNPNHLSADAARAAGHGDVIAHGMLIMGYLGRLLTDWVPQDCIRRFDARFISVTRLHECIVCSGRVVEVIGDGLVKVEVQACNLAGDVRVAGNAIVALPA